MRIWVMAARPRTLPAAVAPVLVGTAAAVAAAGELPRLGAFLAALAGSVLIQIGDRRYQATGATTTRAAIAMIPLATGWRRAIDAQR